MDYCELHQNAFRCTGPYGGPYDQNVLKGSKLKNFAVLWKHNNGYNTIHLNTSS